MEGIQEDCCKLRWDLRDWQRKDTTILPFWQINESLGVFCFKQKESKESADITGQIHKHMLLKARSEATQSDTI